jgi:hypothetical protein
MENGKMFQDEYYIIERENNDNYPLFSWDESSGNFGLGKPVESNTPIKLRLGEPISPNFEWVDYHKLPDPVLSQRVADVLAPMNIYGIQLVPAKVRNPKDPSDGPHEYWLMHVWNRIFCLDTEQSKIRTNRAGTRIFSIDKFVLSAKALELIELPKRQVFELAEKTSVLLVHQSIKDAIMSVNPRGVRFFPANDWNSDSSFE